MKHKLGDIEDINGTTKKLIETGVALEVVGTLFHK